MPPPRADGLSATKVRAQIREELRELEAGAHKQRKALDFGVMGMDRVREVGYRSSPSSLESYFESEPSVSGEDAEQRRTIKQQLRAFVNLYRQALEKYKEEGAAVFPEGTWWMRRCLRATCGCPSG